MCFYKKCSVRLVQIHNLNIVRPTMSATKDVFWQTLYTCTCWKTWPKRIALTWNKGISPDIHNNDDHLQRASKLLPYVLLCSLDWCRKERLRYEKTPWRKSIHTYTKKYRHLTRVVVRTREDVALLFCSRSWWWYFVCLYLSMSVTVCRYLLMYVTVSKCLLVTVVCLCLWSSVSHYLSVSVCKCLLGSLNSVC